MTEWRYDVVQLILIFICQSEFCYSSHLFEQNVIFSRPISLKFYANIISIIIIIATNIIVYVTRKFW